jgi:hypothetical protein
VISLRVPELANHYGSGSTVAENPAPSITFHYIKSNLFRVIYTNGVIGGITPAREIFVSLFNERGALPKVVEQAILGSEKLGDEIRREGKEGFVREMEVGVLMNARVAEDIANFLLERVRMLRESKQELSESTTRMKT